MNREDHNAGDPHGLVEQPSPSSTKQLELVRERQRAPINEFLEQRHPLGSVPGWKACFSARYRDTIVAVVILGRPVARKADDGTELSITRFCRRDDRPANTGSWLIARARNWARLEGYDTLSAHAGVAGNYGTVYEAVAFILDCPHCDWRGHSNELIKRVVDEPLADRFPIFEVGETAEVCPVCEFPPLTLADGKGWLSQGQDRDTWEDYLRRKWVSDL